MARIFSINFLHAGNVRSAMVSVRVTPFFEEYSINMLDEDVARLLPNNKIISTSRNSFVFSDSTSENAPELMTAIIMAVADHMQALHV